MKMDYAIEFFEKEKKFIFTVSTKNDISINEVLDDVSGLSGIKRIEIKS